MLSASAAVRVRMQIPLLGGACAVLHVRGAARARCCACAVLRVRGAARAAEGALESHHLHLLLELIRVIIVARRHRVPVVAMEVDERATLGREIHVRVIDGLRVLAHLPTPRDG